MNFDDLHEFLIGNKISSMEIIFIWIPLKILAHVFVKMGLYIFVCMHMCLWFTDFSLFFVWKIGFCSKFFLQVQIGDSRSKIGKWHYIHIFVYPCCLFHVGVFAAFQPK